MSFSEKSSQHLLDAERVISGVRLLVLASGTALLPLFLDRESTLPWLAYPSLVVGWVYGAWMYWAQPYRRSPWLIQTYATVMMDGALTLLWLTATGGARSPFFLIFYLSVLSVAIRGSARATALVAAVYGLSYLALAAWLAQLAPLLPELAVRVTFIGLTAAMGATLAHEAQVRGQRAERKKVEEVQARLGSIVESSNDAIVGTTIEGVIESWNAAATAVFGYSAQEVLGKSVSLLLPPGDDHESELLTEQVTRGVRVEPFETRRRHKEGHLIDVSLSLSPIHKATGELAGASRIFRDISRRKAVEHRLRRSEAQLAEAQHLAHIGSWEWDVGADRITWSDELYRIFGLEPGSLTPTFEEYLRLLPEDEAPKVEATVEASLRSGRPFWLEHRLNLASGETRMVRGRGAVVRDEDGRVVRMIGTAEDITEQKRAQEVQVALLHEQAAREAAELAVRAHENFCSIASHELRTPLTSLKLQVDTLKKHLSSSADVELVSTKLSSVERQANRMVRLIANLLDVSRINASRLDLELEDLDLAQLAREVAERHQEDARRTGTPLWVHVEGPLWGRWDRLRMDQVIDNLLSNALKYGKGKPVSLSLEERSGQVHLTVRDEGIGIAPEAQERIFQRFERAVPGRHIGGIGLGLWIVRQFVESMGGRVELDSAPGKGSTFLVELPQVRASSFAVDAASAPTR
ncbi:MAG: PAS domain-containing sensor histidine kinase [Myxococcota bacterium]